MARGRVAIPLAFGQKTPILPQKTAILTQKHGKMAQKHRFHQNPKSGSRAAV
jgi:hypothetical protein